VIEQVCGEGVAQDVGRDLAALDADGHRKLFQELAQALAREVAAIAVGWKEPGRGGAFVALAQLGTPGREPGDHGGARRLVQRDHALLAALAAHDQHALIAHDGGHGQRDQLRDAQAGGVQQLQQRRQAQTIRALQGVGGLEQLTDLGLAQQLGQRPALARRVDGGDGIVRSHALAHEEAVELANGRQPPRRRARRHAGAIEGGEIGAQGRGIGRRQLGAATGEKAGKIGEIARIGLDRVVRGVALGTQHLDEAFEVARAHLALSGKSEQRSLTLTLSRKRERGHCVNGQSRWPLHPRSGRGWG